MNEKKITETNKKKVYKAPVAVKSVEVGKILQGMCVGSCGSQVQDINSNCGH